MLSAVILAGSQQFNGEYGVRNKAFLRLNGKLMIEYVIEALNKTGNIEKIVVVGPEGQLKGELESRVDNVIDANGSIMENVAAGVRYLGTEEGILICSCDIPYITPEAINDFIDQAQRSGADLCYPIVEKKVTIKKFPAAERTYVKVKEGIFTGGNIFYINSKAVEIGFKLGERLLNARKKPLQMAGILGIGFLIRLLTGKLSIREIEKKFIKISDIKAKAIFSNYAEIGHDVDKPGDVIFAKAFFEKKNTE